jgi:hypothetical protein
VSRYTETDGELIQRIIRAQFGKTWTTDDEVTNDDWVRLDNIALALEQHRIRKDLMNSRGG